MDVIIAHGRRIVSDDVRALTKDKVGRLGHLCPGLDRAEVRFSEEHNPRIADRECCEVIIIGHGRSNPNAIKNAIRVAAELCRARVNEKIEQELSAIAAVAARG